MKLFTKIALGIAGFFFGVAAICLVAAFAMGVTTADVQTMVRDGKFSFGPEDGIHIQLWGDEELEGSCPSNHHGSYQDSSDYTSEHEIPHVCTVLNVKLGAGKVNIYYDDVPFVQVQQKNIPGFLITTSDVDQSVYIRGDLDIIDNSNASLTIILPRNIKFEAIYLEIGASEANVSDIIAEEFTFVVGAGQANLSNIGIDHFDIEVGAGEVVAKNVSVRNLDVEAGVGEVDIEIAGAESDYSYDIECGIGEVIVGNRSFGGMGGSEKVANLNAVNEMNIECGIGKVNVQFTCNVTDGTCQDSSHHHIYIKHH